MNLLKLAVIISILSPMFLAYTIKNDKKNEIASKDDTSILWRSKKASPINKNKLTHKPLENVDSKCVWYFCSMPKKQRLRYLETLLIMNFGSRQKLMEQIRKKEEAQRKEYLVKQKGLLSKLYLF